MEQAHTQDDDFLDEMTAEFSARNPAFPHRLEEEIQRRGLLHDLAAIRIRSCVSQTALATRMNTTQPTVARLETGAADVKLSTLQRYAASLGKRIEWRIVDA